MALYLEADDKRSTKTANVLLLSLLDILQYMLTYTANIVRQTLQVWDLFPGVFTVLNSFLDIQDNFLLSLITRLPLFWFYQIFSVVETQFVFQVSVWTTASHGIGRASCSSKDIFLLKNGAQKDTIQRKFT